MRSTLYFDEVSKEVYKRLTVIFWLLHPQQVEETIIQLAVSFVKSLKKIPYSITFTNELMNIID